SSHWSSAWRASTGWGWGGCPAWSGDCVRGRLRLGLRQCGIVHRRRRRHDVADEGDDLRAVDGQRRAVKIRAAAAQRARVVVRRALAGSLCGRITSAAAEADRTYPVARTASPTGLAAIRLAGITTVDGVERISHVAPAATLNADIAHHQHLLGDHGQERRVRP